MTTLFRDEKGRAVMEAAYERFRARLPEAKEGALESRVVSTRFGDTHVLVTGPANAPPLVVLHGALASSAHVLGELDSMRSAFRVYAVDVLGQSVKSADARIDVRGTAYGEWLVDVLDGLGLATAHLYGISWGGFVARKLIELAPERVDRLVLMVPAGIVTGSAWKGFTRVGLPLSLYLAFPSEARLRRFGEGILTTLDDDWLPYIGEAFRAYKLDIRLPPLAEPAPLAAFTRPTLVIAAEEDVSFPGAALLARAAVLFPHAETELLAATRHSPPTDDRSRAKLAERVTRFLRS